MRRFTLGMIGFGAIGRSLAERLLAAPKGHKLSILALRRNRSLEEAPNGVAFADDLGALLAAGPDLVVECASQEALAAMGPAVLESGCDLLAASIGALADPVAEKELSEAARSGKSRLLLPAGAIAGIDGLAAARLAGLTEVTYSSRKPPLAWKGTHAEALCDLESLKEERLLFEGNAREGSRLFPKNANVAATVALAGLGLDATRVRILADPSIHRNCHEVEAAGAFGSLSLRLANLPSPGNPKTSFLTILSLEKHIRDRWAEIVI